MRSWSKIRTPVFALSMAACLATQAQEATAFEKPAGCGNIDAFFQGILAKYGLGQNASHSDIAEAAATNLGDPSESIFAGGYLLFKERQKQIEGLRKIQSQYFNMMSTVRDLAASPFSAGGLTSEWLLTGQGTCLQDFDSGVAIMLGEMVKEQRQREPGLNETMMEICGSISGADGMATRLLLIGQPQRQEGSWGPEWSSIEPGRIKAKYPDGNTADFYWDAPPATIDIKGFSITLSADAQSIETSRLAADIHISGGFDLDPSSPSAAVLSESGKFEHDSVTVTVTPPKELTPDVILFLHVGAAYGPGFTYKYQAVP